MSASNLSYHETTRLKALSHLLGDSIKSQDHEAIDLVIEEMKATLRDIAKRRASAQKTSDNTIVEKEKP